MIQDDLKLMIPKEYPTKFDIDLQKQDFVRAEGIDAVYTGIADCLLTRLDEIAYPLPNYEDFGSRLFELVKKQKNPLTTTYIEEYIREALFIMSEYIDINDITIKDESIYLDRDKKLIVERFNICLDVTYKETNEKLEFNFNLEV